MGIVATGFRDCRSPGQPPSSALARRGTLQRKCACGGGSGMEGQCAECHEQDPGLQRFARDSNGLAVAPPSVGEVLRSPGRPLDGDTRAFMESRFGYDFGTVRVHADRSSAVSAKAVHARAFTVGRDIVFNEGEYAPASAEGKRL